MPRWETYRGGGNPENSIVLKPIETHFGHGFQKKHCESGSSSNKGSLDVNPLLLISRPHSELSWYHLSENQTHMRHNGLCGFSSWDLAMILIHVNSPAKP